MSELRMTCKSWVGAETASGSRGSDGTSLNAASTPTEVDESLLSGACSALSEFSVIGGISPIYNYQ